ncbi:hypothetical protein ACIKT0_18005 [Hansschlegelia beijingensis]|uniref:hypothetical protein n=1 Tax=Hansschlegelia beijingensis TaxID=1133344 RepID=UPI00387F16A5
MTAGFFRASFAAALGLGLGCSPAWADNPFAGTWAPSCNPAPAKVVDNKLATLVFLDGAVKFSDFQCEILGWRKQGKRYRSELTCFKKGAEPVKGELAVRQVGEKLKVVVSEGAYAKILERCGN